MPALEMLGAPQAPASPALDKQTDSIVSALEAPKEETKVPDEALSPKIAALAKREKAIRLRALEERRKIDAERQALDAERQEIAQYRQWKQRLSEDPVSVLNEAGISYDKVTSQYLNQSPEHARIQSLEKELKEIRAEQESSKSQFKQNQEDQYAQAKKQIRTEVSLLVDGDESFEAIRTQGEVAKDAVVELIEQTFHENGYIMPVEDAVKEIEEYLIEQALGFARLKKVQSKLAPPVVEPEQKPVSEQTQPQLNTLSNRIMPSVASPMNARERRERAILAFQGKLS